MTRSSLTQTCHLSRAHLEAYSLLSGRSKRLLELEEAIVQGRGTEDVVVKKLLDECGGMSNDGDKLVSRARVWSQLDVSVLYTAGHGFQRQLTNDGLGVCLAEDRTSTLYPVRSVE